MQRMSMVIGIAPEHIEEYKKRHSAVWPEVLARLSQSISPIILSFYASLKT